jgi:hypothetical protein
VPAFAAQFKVGAEESLEPVRFGTIVTEEFVGV